MPRAQASPKAAPVLRHIPSVRPGIEGGSAWFLLGIYVRMVELGLQEGNRGRIPAVTVQCITVKRVCRRGVCGMLYVVFSYNIPHTTYRALVPAFHQCKAANRSRSEEEYVQPATSLRE